VNWFRKDKDGNFLWPGFGDNMRVLKWIVERCNGAAAAYECPIGWMPFPDQFDLEGLEGFDKTQFEQVQKIDKEEWTRELLLQDELFIKLYERLPKEMVFQRELLISRL
jgi:phosphoenolpyruvate carboxykinase (GTP)